PGPCRSVKPTKSLPQSGRSDDSGPVHLQEFVHHTHVWEENMTQVLVRVADYALAVGVNVIFSGARSFRKWLFCIVVLSPAISACAPSYSAKAITTRVVDA